MGSLELKRFDMKNIGSDKVIVFIGKRETGKSILVKDLLYYHQDIPVGTVISGTEGANSYYSKIVPSISHIIALSFFSCSRSFLWPKETLYSPALFTLYIPLKHALFRYINQATSLILSPDIFLLRIL